MATGGRVQRLLCIADPRGSGEALQAMKEAATEGGADAVVVVGDLSSDEGDDYRPVFRALGEIGLPAYWVPGPGDAPVAEYLHEAYNMEVVHPFLHGVHGTAALAPDGHVLFAGLGGDVSDDPAEAREEEQHLRYPRWEPEYRLRVLREFDELQLVLAFWSPPAHKGSGAVGSEAIAELVATHRPRVVVCSGDRSTELIGRSVVVAPGALGHGHYAIADLQKPGAELL
jgi:Icc-related predicted phosphoesterase